MDSNELAKLASSAASLCSRAGSLAGVGQPDEALETSARAISICRDLAGRERDAYLPQLAVALYNHTLWLVPAARRRPADLPLAAEAVSIPVGLGL
jgi:hypothetical protein